MADRPELHMVQRGGGCLIYIYIYGTPPKKNKTRFGTYILLYIYTYCDFTILYLSKICGAVRVRARVGVCGCVNAGPGC